MSATSTTPLIPVSAGRWGDHRIIVFIFLVLALGSVAAISPFALLTLLLDLPWVLAALLPGVALGAVLLSVFRLGNLSRSWRFILGTALGIGIWCQMVLALGLIGWLERWLFLAMVGVAAVILILRWRASVHAEVAFTPTTGNVGGPTGSYAWLWLLAAPFLTLSLLAAANAPGFLWKEEGFGYDVLEYHLQLPREYIEEGRITYRPHNVYANFPANVEMLYLAAMILCGSSQDAGTICHLIHLLLGVMIVAAIWRTVAQWSPQAGMVAGMTAATIGWLPYLSGLAYVELGMLCFGAAATACVLKRRNGGESHEATKPRRRERGEWGWIALAGVLAGFACGCKYTALPLIALPIGFALLLLHRGPMPRRAKAGALFALATLAAFSPWLVKNTVMTGNPVFPLAQRLFSATAPGWGTEETAKWNRGHMPRVDKVQFSDRMSALWRNVPGDHHQRFGPVILALALIGLLLRRMTADDAALIAMLVVQVLVWTFATHLFARFAVVMLIPVALLCGRAVLHATSRRAKTTITVAIFAGAAWNFYFAARLHAAESPGAAPAALFYEGQVPGFEYLGYINRELPKDAKILMVGDARPFYVQRDVSYCVVFNQNPFVAAVEVAQQPGAVAQWLREQGFSHVLVHWMEVERLRRTYGFSEHINEALFSELERVGLRKVREFSMDGVAKRYVSLYEVVRR